MNKKGFTLVELLAVIVILAVVMLIGSVSIAGIRNKMNKNMFEAKLGLAIGAAKTWGQDNKGIIDEASYDYIYMTIGQLIENGALETEETVLQTNYTACESGNKVGDNCRVLTNNIDGSVVNKLSIKIYIKYNRIYACIRKTSSNKTVLKENSSWSEYSDLNYYCS